jgi:hypothetical protein
MLNVAFSGIQALLLRFDFKEMALDIVDDGIDGKGYPSNGCQLLANGWSERKVDLILERTLEIKLWILTQGRAKEYFAKHWVTPWCGFEGWMVKA